MCYDDVVPLIISMVSRELSRFHHSRNPFNGVFPFLHLVVFVLVNHLQHDFCVLRVKLRADSLLNLISHDFLRERVAVASLARHGIVGVGDGDNPRDFRDFLAFETFRVAAAVVPLMVVVSADAYVRRLS